jgi:hypothetical protein
MPGATFLVESHAKLEKGVAGRLLATAGRNNGPDFQRMTETPALIEILVSIGKSRMTRQS